MARPYYGRYQPGVALPYPLDQFIFPAVHLEFVASFQRFRARSFLIGQLFCVSLVG